MSNYRKLTENVMSFLGSTSDLCGRIHADRFSQDMYCQLVEGNISSPIEDLFFIAFHSLALSVYQDINPEPFFSDRDKEWKIGYGVFIHPQAKIGKYKVDFLITQNNIGPDEIYTPVIIELDGHDFHDKDKKQRAYEKARDRFFVKSGYRVLHFTGSEVVKDPFAVAFEAFELIGGNIGSEIIEYNPNNPLGIE